MKTIALTRRKFAMVDDADYEWLSKFKWYAYRSGRTFYAVRGVRKNERVIQFPMHREILGLQKGDKRQTDHADGDGLHNCRANLRICNHKQNQWNGKPRQKGSSEFKGVYWSKAARKWLAYIRVNGKLIYLGLFDNESEAATTYDKKALELFGSFARLNLPERQRRSANVQS